MRPTPGIVSGSLASVALVAAFGCALAVVGNPAGAPLHWPLAIRGGTHDAALRLPAPMATSGPVLRSPGALPIVPVRVTVPASAPRASVPARPAAPKAEPQTTAAPRPVSPAPAAATPVPTTSAATAQPAPPVAPSPTLTQTTGAAITAAGRRAGDALAPVSPPAGGAVAQAGQTVGETVGGLGPH